MNSILAIVIGSLVSVQAISQDLQDNVSSLEIEPSTAISLKESHSTILASSSHKGNNTIASARHTLTRESSKLVKKEASETVTTIEATNSKSASKESKSAQKSEEREAKSESKEAKKESKSESKEAKSAAASATSRNMTSNNSTASSSRDATSSKSKNAAVLTGISGGAMVAGVFALL